MKVIIIGAGFSGVQLAKRLVSERYDVVLIDKDEETVRHASNRLDCMVVQANGNSLVTLEEAGIAKADALVALTESDELNMITCSLADSVYPDCIKIARVRNYEYYKDVEHIDFQNRRPLYGINYMVHPDIEAAEAIVSAVDHGAVSDIIEFEGSDFEVTSVTIEKGSKLDGIYVQNIRTLTENSFLAAYVEHENEAFMPTGSTILQAGDRVGFLARKEHVNEILELCGSEQRIIKKIAVLGAGRIGTLIAERLIKSEKTSFLSRFLGAHKKLSQEFVIIDKDEKLAREAAERFPEANVFRADITDEGFVEEEGLQNFDLIITATHNHELNIVTSAYLNSFKHPRTVCLVTNGSYAEIARNIGIDVAIPIKDVVIDAILSHLRGKNVTRIHTLSEGELEIIEVKILDDSKYIGKTLKDIALAGVFLVLLIKASGSDDYLIPTGNTELNLGDTLVIISNTEKSRIVMENFGVEG